MIYAKRIRDENFIDLMTYDFEPTFSADSNIIIISEEEYNTLFAEMCSKIEDDSNGNESERLNYVSNIEEDV